MRMFESKPGPLQRILVVLFVGAVSLIDLWIDSSSAVPAAYMAGVVGTYRSGKTAWIWAVALACSFLTIVGLLSPSRGEWDTAILNCGLALLAIWVVAWFCVALERERLREGVLRRDLALRSRQLRDMAQLAVAANSASSLDQIMQLLTDQSRLMIGAHQAVTSFTVDKNWSQAITGLSLSDKYADFRSYDAKPDGSGIYAWLCEVNRPVRMTQAELESHPRWRNFGVEAGNHPPMRGWLAVPLSSRDGRSLGLIQLSDKIDGEFTAEDEALLVQVAQMGSAAIEMRRFHEQLEDRVARRTAELSAANQTLLTEIGERKRVEEELRQKSEELAEFNRLAIGREERMIELKRRINELARQAGETTPFDLSFADDLKDAPSGWDVRSNDRH